ncbi:cellulase family glycosylhydrolase [Cellulomonas sp.]|uniref:glycoside hydrolase family 5 protein n=1 Tax=Cellulomonas sp. TaxID=40001 RepID=UPI001B03D36C|nr:cellulase family glycosylhydrolase [Cellulomonas sp.]MBO9553186.1 cellulase family glycosylhydrolase [Cellulomonas sp.]
MVLLAFVGVLSVADPSGLLAPVGGRGMPLLGTGGAYGWAPLLIGLPVLLGAVVVPVLVVAGPGRPVVTGPRVLGVTSVAAVGAGALAEAATAIVAALPMAGPHLSPGSVVRFAFATSGFAALELLVVGPLAGVAAALAFRFGPQDELRGDGPVGRATAAGSTAEVVTTDGTPLVPPPAVRVAFPVVVLLVVVSLAAVGFASTSWRGGPVGYAFAGPLVAPAAAAGVLGLLAGTAVLVGAFAWVLRSLLRRLDDRAVPASVAVWLAAVVAGLVLGVVDAVVAALPGAAALEGAAPNAVPDAWWAATAFVAIATGIGYGVAVGLLAALATGLAWPWRERLLSTAPHVRSRRLAGAAAAVLLLGLPFVVPTPAQAGPQRTTPTAVTDAMPRLQLLPADEPGGLPTIGDESGRQVVLRGVNVNQLIDYYLKDPDVPATGALTDDDFEQIAAMGFDVVRLGMSWSRLEPRRGEIDEAYLRQVRAAVASAKAHGVYVVLDMHEDAWGNAIARPDATCGGGTTPTTGWDGAPAWATITDGTAHCQFMARDLAPAVATAFSNFYTDRDGIQTELVRTWAEVARTFAGEPAVAGYDLLNEPGIGSIAPVTSGLLLGRYYDAAIDAIRAAEQDAGGFAHLVFFEPSVLWSGLAFDVTPPPGFTDDDQLVFAPHPYSESISMDQSLGFTLVSIERNLEVSSRAAAGYGAALWAGEWGWFGDPDVDGAKVQRFVAAQDRLGIGGAFWVWRQGCGSPETGSDATSSGNLVSVDCGTGELSPPPAGFATPLSRAYPRAFPGRLDSLTSGASGRDLELAATVVQDDVGCELDVWVPGDAFPQVRTTGVVDATTTEVPGGWRVTGCAADAYTVSVTS